VAKVLVGPSENDKREALALTPVSRETEQRLEAYVSLLLQWQAMTNLVAPSTLAHLWTRHIADSLQILEIVPNAKTFADLGSGGGFPGIVLACALVGTPGARVHLVERNSKKAAFLREALRITGGAGEVHHRDIVDYVDSNHTPIDCVTARALASLNMLLGFAEPLVEKGAKALFLKGQDIESELTEATKYWTIEPKLYPSRSGGQGWLVEIEEIVRRSNAPAQAGIRT
jgi:16S rRNA (guanine527-N7)-methyltransferase